MDFRQHLIDTFLFNHQANLQMIEKIAEMPEQEEAIKLMSHLIHSQDKWLARIEQDEDANQREWFGPSFDYMMLAHEWTRSLYAWVEFLEEKTEEEVLAEVEYQMANGDRCAAKICDLALQLNYHSIHHRAQIQTMIRQQGLQPDFIDYIGGRFRKL
jgi:uncharacterized damage-inducible protein DinB